MVCLHRHPRPPCDYRLPCYLCGAGDHFGAACAAAHEDPEREVPEEEDPEEEPEELLPEEDLEGLPMEPAMAMWFGDEDDDNWMWEGGKLNDGG